MTPTPPSTTSSSAGAQSPEFRVTRKTRNRVPLSCGPCRHRKLKCNRSKPCENCVKRGDAPSCSYAAQGTRRKNQSQGATSPDDMQNRIDRLEGLVLSLMTNGRQAAGPAAAQDALSQAASNELTSPSQQDEEDGDDMMPEDDGRDSDVESVTNSLGILKVDNEKHKSFYIGDSHWHSVLKDIAEVRNYFVQHKQELDSHYKKVQDSLPPTAINGPAFLFGAHDPCSDEELRAALPPRAAVEKLVTRYFNSYDPAVHILHSPTFHKELYEHWRNPSQTSLVWLGLLYAILCLAMQSYHKIGDEPPEWKDRTLDLASQFRKRTVQCLITSDYTKSVDHTVEALILYIHGEYSSRWDAEVGIWLIVGMLVRLAMRMGYHRDPKHYAGITPYRGEMRRRVWSFIRQSDVMFSFQLGLPSMIRASDSDTEFPRNIFEDEFGPDSTELPAERPITEPTPVSYLVAKAKIAFEFGNILESINSVAGLSGYDDVLASDARLREIQRTLAPHLKLRPIEECTHDPATLLMQRYSLDILYNKTVCVLHRKFALRARQNSRYAPSRQSCLNASLTVLRHQASLYRESQPGGRMRTMKWVISSLTKHDFLLAAMLISLDLYYDTAAAQTRGGSGIVLSTPEQRKDMIGALETSLKIWKESAEVSLEAYKASHILGIMLQKVRTDVDNITVSIPEPISTAEAFAAFDDAKPEHSAAMTLGMLSSGGLTPNSAAMFNVTPQTGSSGSIDFGLPDAPVSTGLTPGFTGDTSAGFPMSIFGPAAGNNDLGDMPMNLDWAAWDSFMNNPNSLDPNNGLGNMYSSTFDPMQANPDMSTDQSSFLNNAFMGANTPGKN